MTARSATSRSASKSTTASVRLRHRRDSSRDEAAEDPNDRERPIKRRRVDTSSTTTPVFHHSRSTTPIPFGSNQDAEIPDIIPSLEGPLIDNFDNDSMVGDDEQSMEDNRHENDESDAPSYLSPAFRRREWMSNFERPSTRDESIAGSSMPRPDLQDDDDDDLGSDQDLQKASRRMPGRRRAPNADPQLEASLRRQLQLRMGHRAISKALKPILLELASRTSDHIEHRINEEGFMATELDLQSELRGRLDQRLQQLEAALNLGTHYYSEKFASDEEYLQRQFLDFAASIHEDYYVRAENRILALARQHDHDVDENVTDDEGGAVIQPLHRFPSSRNPVGTMPGSYDSRSRFFLATQELSEKHDFQAHIYKQQNALLHDNNDRALEDSESAINVEPNQFPGGFGLADEARRTEAMSALNLHSLASAASQIEEQALRRQQAVVPNEKAFGLQALVIALDYVKSNAVMPKTASATNLASILGKREPEVKTEHGQGEMSLHQWPLISNPDSPSHVPGAAKAENDFQQRLDGAQRHQEVSMAMSATNGLADVQSVSASDNINLDAVSGRYSHKAADSTMSPTAEHRHQATTNPRNRFYSSSGLRVNPMLDKNSLPEQNGSSPHSNEASKFWQSIPSSERRLLGSDRQPIYNSYRLPRNDQKPEADANWLARRPSDAMHAMQERNPFRPRSPHIGHDPWQPRGANTQPQSLDIPGPRAHPPDPPTAIPSGSQHATSGVIPGRSQGQRPESAAQHHIAPQTSDVFFGPTPPPQFGGPPSGSLRQFPWHRQ